MAFSGKTSLRRLVFQESPSLFWDKPVASSVLAGVVGRFCVFGQPLIQEKPSLGKKPFRKNPWPFGKTYIGKNSFEKPIVYLRKTYLEKPTTLFGKNFQENPFGKKPILSVIRVRRYLGTLGSLQNHEYSVTCQTHASLLIQNQQVNSFYGSTKFFGPARLLPCLLGGPCVELVKTAFVQMALSSVWSIYSTWPF